MKIKALIDGLDRIVEIELAGGDDSSVEFSVGHRRKIKDAEDEPRVLTQYVNMWKRDKEYENTVRHPLITGIAKTLLKTPEVRLWHDHIISKPPRGQWSFQVSSGFLRLAPFCPTTFLAAGLLLMMPLWRTVVCTWFPAATETPASPPKRKRKRKMHRQKIRTLKTERAKMEEQPASFGVPVELSTGECMFHHCLNFHATPPNTT